MAKDLSRRGPRALRLAALCGFLAANPALAGSFGDAARVGATPGNFHAPAPVAARGAYGGGFIELLVTGEDPSRRLGYLEQAPPPGADAPYYLAPPERTPPPQLQRAVEPLYLRREVDYSGREAPGSVVVDTRDKFLYYVQRGGRAIRYGVGVGRPGFEWAGVKTISRKAEWPSWTPPAEMLARRPDLPRHMPGGPENPLGARALYLGSSLYRIHGTNEPHTIGQNVSSGCIRMMNDDVIDLYARVRVGTQVVVR